MKTLLTLLALTFALPSFAHAQNSCAFGSSTGDLSDMLDSNSHGKIWYKGEQLSITSRQRLQGLSSLEKKMILIAKGAALSSDKEKEETLNDFADNDGYLTYFSHNSNGREFVQVGSYPGDNEFGVILEIKSLSRKREYKILSIAAVISDGDLEDCKVQ